MHQFLLITIFIGGCGFMNKDDSKETEIKKVLIRH